MGWEKIHNQKQCEIIEINKKLKPEILLLDGAFGSGKTYIQIPLFMAHVMKYRGQGVKFIITGHTLGSLKRNVLDPITDIYGVDTTINPRDNSFQLYGNSVCCFGTDKADSYEPIRGIMTAYGHYANELTLSNRQAIDEVMARCRGDGARFYWETNPGDPQHWIYKTYIEPWEGIGNNHELCRVNMTMYDNDKQHGGFLPDSYIKRMEKTYSGVWFKKYVLGQWAAIEGQIYHMENLQFYDDDILDKSWWLGVTIIGALDPAAGSRKSTGCFTTLLTAVIKQGKIYIIDAVVKKIGVKEIIQAVSDRVKKWNYNKITVEDNFSQDLYVLKPIKEAFPFHNIQGQSAREEKISRLVGMQNVVESKVLFPKRFLSERNTDGWLLIQQLLNVTAEPLKKAESADQFLDGPDCLEQLIRSARTMENHGRAAAAGGKPIISNDNWQW